MLFNCNCREDEFLEMDCLRHSGPFNLRKANFYPDITALNPSFKAENGLYDVVKKKSKYCYFLSVLKKACFPNNA